MTFRARIAAATLAAGLVAAAPAAAAPPVQPGQQGFPQRAVCGPPKAGHARCHAKVITKADGVTPLAGSAPVGGYGPADLVKAYNLPAAPPSTAPTQTIAIVDAYDLPSAENDLNVYRSYYFPNLPACTSANGCFTKVNQSGSPDPNTLPAVNASWGQEIALDIDMASAICPSCNILLVEANSSSIADLGGAVNTAARLGATVISNSYGANEFSGETAYDTYYNHSGIPVTVSSGDSGYGVEYPAASRYVTAVGGTSLKTTTLTTRGFTETAWSGAGSGCSALETKPTWQQPISTGCSRRTVADVSAVADPNTGVAVYDSTDYQGSSGWMVFGGTSVAAPVIAGVYALAGDAQDLSWTYNNTASLFDVTSGSNGRCRKTVTRLCTATTGYDGPTGLGTPNGVGAF